MEYFSKELEAGLLLFMKAVVSYLKRPSDQSKSTTFKFQGKVPGNEVGVSSTFLYMGVPPTRGNKHLILYLILLVEFSVSHTQAFYECITSPKLTIISFVVVFSGGVSGSLTWIVYKINSNFHSIKP